METIRWGILGTGAIAQTFARNMEQAANCRLVAIGSRSAASARSFAGSFGIARSYDSYEALLADDSVDAVYISTPHPFHAQWAIKAAEAGKHILCQKPLAMNATQGRLIQAAARASGVFLAEAFMYRFHPQTAKLVELIREGAIGEVQRIRSVFGFDAGERLSPSGRLLNPELGGGGILDIGCYTVSAARLVAGAAIGRPFDNPVKVTGQARIGMTGVDEEARATLAFPSGIVGEVACAIRADLGTSLDVEGSAGSLHIGNPWQASRDRPMNGHIIIRRGQSGETIEIPCSRTAFTLEAEAVAEAIRAGHTEPSPPAMTWEDSIGNLETLDAWLREAGRGQTGPDESLSCRCGPAN